MVIRNKQIMHSTKFMLLLNNMIFVLYINDLLSQRMAINLNTLLNMYAYVQF